MAPASLANFNTRQGREREDWWGKEGERWKESEANKTHVRCRQAASLSSATCEIYFRAAPFSDALWQTPTPTFCTRIRISTANPDSTNLNQVREFWQNQKVASANRLEAFRALANENTFIFTSPPGFLFTLLTPFATPRSAFILGLRLGQQASLSCEQRSQFPHRRISLYRIYFCFGSRQNLK